MAMHMITLIKIFFQNTNVAFGKTSNHVLVTMIEKIKTTCDNKEFCDGYSNRFTESF